MRFEFLTGSYARPEEDGICRFVLDTERETLARTHAWQGFSNPSYLIRHPERPEIYAVEELSPEGRIVSARLEGDQLTVEDRVSSHGADPCHLCLWPDGKTLVACNYTDGSFAVYRVGQEGTLTLTQAEKKAGGSVHPRRQECAHMHFSAWRGGLSYMVDLGTDRVYLRRADESRNMLAGETAFIPLPPGCGPRHIAFGEEGFLYIVSELQNRVLVFERRDQQYRLIQTVDTARDGLAAAIRYQDHRLFVSNRGEDSVVMYAVDEHGLLTALDRCPTGGRIPRDIYVTDGHIIVCNQGSSLLTVLRLTPDRMRIQPTALRCGLPAPTCVCPV